MGVFSKWDEIGFSHAKLFSSEELCYDKQIWCCHSAQWLGITSNAFFLLGFAFGSNVEQIFERKFFNILEDIWDSKPQYATLVVLGRGVYVTYSFRFHLWYNACQPLGGQHGNRADLAQLPVSRHWWDSKPMFRRKFRHTRKPIVKRLKLLAVHYKVNIKMVK